MLENDAFDFRHDSPPDFLTSFILTALRYKEAAAAIRPAKFPE